MLTEAPGSGHAVSKQFVGRPSTFSSHSNAGDKPWHAAAFSGSQRSQAPFLNGPQRSVAPTGTSFVTLIVSAKPGRLILAASAGGRLESRRRGSIPIEGEGRRCARMAASGFHAETAAATSWRTLGQRPRAASRRGRRGAPDRERTGRRGRPG